MSKPKSSKLSTIIWLSLLTGTLDAIAAIIISYPVAFGRIFRYIASGFFGKVAFTANYMIFWGLLFHYLIATVFTVVFFVAFPLFKSILKNKYLTGIIYGLIIWVVMNIIVLPLTNVPKHPATAHFSLLAAITSLAALVICVGLPISLVADRYYAKSK
jgi:hypothetical protein